MMKPYIKMLFMKNYHEGGEYDCHIKMTNLAPSRASTALEYDYDTRRHADTID